MGRWRTCISRSLGLDHRSLREAHGRQIVVRRCRVEFYRPARLDDFLSISTQLVEMKGARIHLAQRIERAGTLLVELEVELAVTDLNGRPSRLPAALRGAVEGQRAPPHDA